MLEARPLCPLDISPLAGETRSVWASSASGQPQGLPLREWAGLNLPTTASPLDTRLREYDGVLRE